MVEQALYEDVSLVRLLSMRNTLFAVSTEVAPAVDASSARAVAAKERRKLLKHLKEDGQGLDEHWLADTETQTLAALTARGRATGSELSAAVPASAHEDHRLPRDEAGDGAGVASRVIRVLAADGRIRRDRPRGSWTSSQFRWTAAEPWPPSDPAGRGRSWPAAGCASYGPGTEGD